MLELLGLNLAYLLAGFAGGVVALFFTQVTRWKAVGIVFGGMVGANYLTTMAQFYLTLSDKTDKGVAFVVGMIAMYLFGGIMKRGQSWQADPKLPTDKGQQ